MSVINFNGVISPTFFTSFATGKVNGAHPSADDTYEYYLANEAVFEFTLEVPTATGVVVITRHATAADPLYDKARPCYICDPTPSAALEKLADAVKGNTLVPATLKSVKVWVKPFFLEILRLMTRTEPDTFTLARPDAASKAAVEKSFNHEFKGDVGIVSHPADVVKEIKEIPCDLSGVTVFPPSGPGLPPRVALSVIMRIKERLSVHDRDEVARIFIAADYSKIYKHAKTTGRAIWFMDVPPTGIEIELRQWERNVAHYLWNHTSLQRGDAIFKEIVAAGVAAAAAGKSTLEIVKIVRDEIDARLITANHWGQRREDRLTETYQRKLSDVFGAIHQKQFFMASPVAWLRNLASKRPQENLLGLAPGVGLQNGQRVLISLQWGVGHCQEHASVSFEVLAAIMNAGHLAKFGNIILSGNANIDHTFVVGGLKSPVLFQTRRSKEFFREARADDINVFDLRDALIASGADGFVCDPYLAPSEIPPTCKGLLAKLNDKEHAARLIADKTIADLRTDFLLHANEHPPRPSGPPPVTVLGLKGL
jgi:hypothetical protein